MTIKSNDQQASSIKDTEVSATASPQAGNVGWRIKNTRELCYPVRLVPPLCDSGLSELIDAIGTNTALMVTTPTVKNLYAADINRRLKNSGVDVSLLVVECDETSKALSQVQLICEYSMSHELPRNGLLVSIGGGVCSDLVTMAASWIRRGIRHVRVPTTLVGQVDAAIGIKGAVNFHDKKSYLGCFHAPADVLIDPTMLASLPPDQLRCGLSEILKIGLALDQTLFHLIERFGNRLIDSRDEIINRSINGMLGQLEANLFEDQTFERLVDFGHTFSPLLESATGFAMPHGHAVAVDMALSSAIACEMDLLDSATLERILALLGALDLPIYSKFLSLSVCRESLTTASIHRGGRPNLVVPVAIGRADFIRSEIDLTDMIIRRALDVTRNNSASRLDSLSSAYA